ncbi:hypothetical protein [Nocardioides pakistanensis]
MTDTATQEIAKALCDGLCHHEGRYRECEKKATTLLDSPAMTALRDQVRAEAWRASRLDLAHELRESGAWAEVRMAEWVEMRADRGPLGPDPTQETEDAEVPDHQICPDCLGGMNVPDHYGCSFCGGCECQGEC